MSSAETRTAAPKPDFIAVVKQDCPTCQLVVPVLAEIVASGATLRLITQDEPEFPPLSETECLTRAFDQDLHESHALGVEIVPTLFRGLQPGVESAGSEQALTAAVGWNKEQWRELTALPHLGADLPDARPGCGALNVEEQHRLRLVSDAFDFGSRRIDLGNDEDPIEAMFARGWSDGLPLVPPTPERVLHMLEGTTREAREVIGSVAPDYVDCTVEKAAVNAVMAGCRPEYLPVVLAAIEAACDPAFNWHGLAATTHFAGPVMVVNGPIVEQIGLNHGFNALGQGSRANLTIGRALNLTLRNVGGARPGEIDRAALGNPGKLSFCIAENEPDSAWNSLASSRGIADGESAVTLFAGEGPRGVVDQLSREPESLCRSLAACLRTVGHPKHVLAYDALVVVGPEHMRVFERAGWSREQTAQKLLELLMLDPAELVRGAGDCAEGVPEQLASADALPKFRPDGLLLVHAGGDAGLFSSIIGGWVNGTIGSAPVTHRIR